MTSIETRKRDICPFYPPLAGTLIPFVGSIRLQLGQEFCWRHAKIDSPYSYKVTPRVLRYHNAWLCQINSFRLSIHRLRTTAYGNAKK